jgi:uncharacterized secreted protein with C-terminal beta-propeller domain
LLGVVPLLASWSASYAGTRYYSTQPDLRKFSSYEELRSFLQAKRDVSPYYKVEFTATGRLISLQGRSAITSPSGLNALSETTEVVIPPHSTTNVQVEDVDEADTVKTDGEFIYTVSENSLFILKAYPVEEVEVLSQIQMNGTVEGIFINDDRLVVFEEKDWKTFVRIFNVSDRRNPSQAMTISRDGSYFNSRMIGDYVYLLTDTPAGCCSDEVNLPKTYLPDRVEETAAEEIYYIDAPDYNYQFTTITAINVNYDLELAQKVILVGCTREMYMSLNNVYIAFRDFERTFIHRIHIDGKEIECVASGEVPGYVLNQFSMDEHGEHFRIATATGNVMANSASHVYVLGLDLNITGRLEGLAAGETLHSVRFMGNRCYLVTFKKIDPLFVIDLKDPSSPRVLGELKITGYSDYLHPYDENHIIGIGKETVEGDGGNFAWYQGVKISLFDVSNVEEPKEVAKYEIGNRGTESPVLNDHKALLFDKSKNLLVIPVLVAEIDQTNYAQRIRPNAFGLPVYQGVYVFNVTLSEGLVLKDRVTHMDGDLMDICIKASSHVKRSLYIGDILYTISDTKVKMNDLGTLAEINEVQLSP